MRRLAFATAFTVGVACSLCAQSAPEVRPALINGRFITYEIRGGYAVVQGDIILGTAAEVEAATGLAGGKAPKPQSSVLSFNTASPTPWPNATMYYTIDPDIPDPQRILDGVQHWNDHTPLKILPRTNQPNYVRFQRNTTLDAACSSYLGMLGGEQTIETTENCNTGSVIHELGHAWGLLHEQERNDRNAYITVLYQNIDKRMFSNFDQALTSGQDVSYYDYDSLMHYGPTGFTRNGLDSMETVPVGIPIGQRNGLSAGDIDSVSRLYGFPPPATTITTAPAGLPIVVDGVSALSPQSFNWAAGATHTIGISSPVGTDPRHVFVRWSDGGDATHTVTAAPGQTVFCADFQVRHLLTTGVAAGSGTAAAAPVSPDGYYPERQPVRVSATPSDGNQFVRWTGTTNPQASGYSVSAPTAIIEVALANSQYLANFSAAPLTTIDSTPQGRTITVDGTAYLTPVRFAWTAGSAHTLDLTASQTSGNNTAHYQFTGWEDGSPGKRTVAAGAGAATFTASFTTQHLLSTYTIGPGRVSVSPPSTDGYYGAGTTVQVTAIPNGGSTLRYWLGDFTDGTAVHSLTMDQQHAVTAYFDTALPFSVLNAASFLGNPVFDNAGFRVAPLELVTIFGDNIGPSSLLTGEPDSSGALPTSLGGTRVLFDTTPAPIVYTARNQLSAVIPVSVAGKTSTVVWVEKNGATVAAVSVSAGDTAPALFTSDSSGKGQVAAFNQDFSINSPSNPAAPGSVVVLYGTGAGLWTEAIPDGQITGSHLVGPRAPVFVRVGKLPAQVIYAGTAPTLVNGVLQVNAVLPPELLSDPATPIQLIVGPYSSPPGTTIAVR